MTHLMRLASLTALVCLASIELWAQPPGGGFGGPGGFSGPGGGFGGPGGGFRGRGDADRGGRGGADRGRSDRGGSDRGGPGAFRGRGVGPPGGMMGPGGGPPEGFRGPQGGRDGDRGRGGPPGGDASDRASRFEGFLRSMDRNGNGVLEPSEIPQERRAMLGAMATRMGLDPNQPIALSKIRETLENRSRTDAPKQEDEKKKDEPEPLVPGFGEEVALARVPEFGERVESLVARTAGQGTPKGSTAAAGDRNDRVRGFAEGMLRRYDRNQNGVLEKDEWEGMRGADGADLNGDGVITLDELTKRLADYSRRRSEQSEEGGSKASDDRRSYRLATAVERLPNGLPDWFLERDANGDGQVAMSEFASVWSPDEASRFARFDHNGDGIITAREALAGERDKADDRPGVLVDARSSGSTGGGTSSGNTSSGGAAKAWWE